MEDLVKQIAALEPLAAAATEGPWRIESGRYDALKEASIHEIARREGGGHVLAVKPFRMAHKANAAFIAAARNLLTPANLAALRAALSQPAAAPAPVGVGELASYRALVADLLKSERIDAGLKQWLEMFQQKHGGTPAPGTGAAVGVGEAGICECCKGLGG